MGNCACSSFLTPQSDSFGSSDSDQGTNSMVSDRAIIVTTNYVDQGCQQSGYRWYPLGQQGTLSLACAALGTPNAVSFQKSSKEQCSITERLRLLPSTSHAPNMAYT